MVAAVEGKRPPTVRYNRRRRRQWLGKKYATNCELTPRPLLGHHSLAKIAVLDTSRSWHTPATRWLTFAYPVAKRDWAEERRFEEGLQRLKRWIV
jgi:hypothetical protein